MKRRNFIQQTAGATALITLGGFGLQSFALTPSTKKITILHTNDVHSHIDAFAPNAARNANQGGVARRATLARLILIIMVVN